MPTAETPTAPTRDFNQGNNPSYMQTTQLTLVRDCFHFLQEIHLILDVL